MRSAVGAAQPRCPAACGLHGLRGDGRQGGHFERGAPLQGWRAVRVARHQRLGWRRERSGRGGARVGSWLGGADVFRVFNGGRARSSSPERSAPQQNDGAGGRQQALPAVAHTLGELDQVQHPRKAKAQPPKKKAARRVPNLIPYLAPVARGELRHLRFLSSLSSLTYRMERLTPAFLDQVHNLKLVTTSRACSLPVAAPFEPPGEVFAYGDAMATFASVDGGLVDVASSLPPPLSAEGFGADNELPPGGEERAVARGAAEREEEEARERVRRAMLRLGTDEQQDLTVEETLARRLGDAAAAASDRGEENFLTRAAGNWAIASTLGSVLDAVMTSLPGLGHGRQQRQQRQDCGPAAIVMGPSARALEPIPTEWFVCDDDVSRTRYVVIQGSDNVDSWITNLTFEPVPFEDPKLEVTIHKGVYQVAQSLYERIVPLVHDHLSSSPYARVCFVGHSLGGALSSALMMMAIHRGVAKPEQLEPVYTFGGAAAFCDTRLDRGGDAPGPVAPEDAARGHNCPFLARFGLPPSMVKNVVMHRDAVPRAFFCDYSPVRDIMLSWGGPYAKHPLLAKPSRRSGKPVMFTFPGQIMILQPAAHLHFVAEEEGEHELLPRGGGLWTIVEPDSAAGKRAARQRAMGLIDRAMAGPSAKHAKSRPHPRNGDLPLSEYATAVGGDGASMMDLIPVRGALATNVPPEVAEVTVDLDDEEVEEYDPGSAWEAALAAMDSPHPLIDILASSRAYGDNGSISRYHNPDSYTRALRCAYYMRKGSMAGCTHVEGDMPAPTASRRAQAETRSRAQ
ncbi:unnamed protein product [Pedinophyceae sp. YPF-701]|nr:unnamed protein product [Pedinophyceae sp. YPF-701]